MGVLRRAYVEVLPDTDGFDGALTKQLKAADPGGKSGKLIGKQLGGQLNLALARLDLPAIDVKADPKAALAAIDAVEAKLHLMAGSAATVEVKVQTEKAIGQLGRFRKQLGDVGVEGGAEAAVGFASRFGANLGPLISKTGTSPQILAAAAGIGGVLAPIVGAALSAAVIGGAGIGGVVGGVILAARDPRVQAAMTSLSERLQARLTAAGRSFVGPVLAGMDQIDRALAKIDLEGVLASASRFVKPLAAGISSAMVDLGDGIGKLVRNAGPVVDAIGQGIAEIGRHLGAGLASLADNGEAAASSLRLIFGLINGSLDTMFTFVRLLTEAYDIARKLGLDRTLVVWGRLTRSSMDDVAEGGRKVGSGTFGAADGVKALGSASAAAERPQKALVGTLSLAEKAALGERSAMVALSNQLRAQADPAFALIEAQKALKTAQDRAAEATKKHGKNSDEARTATRQLALAAIDLQGKAGALSSSFNGKLSPAMRDAFKAAGLTKSQINAVATEFRNAKRDGDRYSKKYQATVNITGQVKVGSELARLLAVQAALRSGNPLTAGVVNKAMRDVLGPQINRAMGGPINGPGTETSDDVPAMLSKNEYVVRAASARKIGRRGMEYINKYGELPVGLATGGQVGWPYPATARMTRIPSLAEVSSKVAPAFGKWPSSPSAQRGDSGVWRKILALVKGSGIPYQFGNAYRPGDPKWHGSGRAIDFMGYNQNRLANFFMARQSKVLELIHRTKSRDYGITRGHYNAMPTQWPLHRNHLHIAMAGGGVINEPVVGQGLRSGASYSFGERGPETVTPGVGGHKTYNINIAVPVGAHPAEVGRQTVTAIQAFERSNGSRWRQ